MTQAKRDENRATVGTAWDATNGVTEPLLVDPSTKRLKIDVTLNPALPATSDPAHRIDQNRVPTVYGVTDDANMDIVPIMTDSDGNLIADLTFA